MSNYLESWNDGTAKQSIIDFVASVTNESSPNYVPPVERIATFDNDGTLWCEKPLMMQMDYILHELVKAAKKDPSLQEKQPWKAAMAHDDAWFNNAIVKHYNGDDSLLKVMAGGILSLSNGMPAKQAEANARAFLESVNHPTLGFPYKDAIYQPMVEVLQYLEVNGFTNYIVSGGGRDFMRDMTAELYNVPRDRVLGSRVEYNYVEKDGVGNIVQTDKLDIVDDGPGKPIQIWNVIGRRPILAAGNANGDLPMMTFAGGSTLPVLRLLLVHDDAKREFDYDAGAENALKMFAKGAGKGWTTISVKNDWKMVFEASE